MWKRVPKDTYEGLHLDSITIVITKSPDERNMYYSVPKLADDTPLEVVDRFLRKCCIPQNCLPTVNHEDQFFFALAFRGHILRASTKEIYVWCPDKIKGNRWRLPKHKDSDPGRFNDILDERLLEVLNFSKDNGSTAKDPIVNDVSGA